MLLLGCDSQPQSAGTGGTGPGAGGNALAGGTGGLPSGTGGLPAGTGGFPLGSGGATGSGGAVSTGGGAATVGTITDLLVEPNPNSVLSAYVSWTTTEPSDSQVQFGEWEIAGANGVTEHRVLLIGMRAETDYQIHVTSTGPSGSLTGNSSFRTGSLPTEVPVATISVSDARRQPGWTLMNVQTGDNTPRALSAGLPAAVIYDEEGFPVWYYLNTHAAGNERGGAISVDSTDVGVLMGPSNLTAPIEVDWAGNELWSCADVTCGGPNPLSHHAGKLSDGTYVVMRDETDGTLTSQDFEIFEAGSTTPKFSIGLLDAMTPPVGASGDWAHGNSITIDLAKDVAYMSFRWLGLIKMNYSESTMLWHLPASYGADGLGDMTFVPPESQFSDIHDPEIHDDGTILFFDNGGWSGSVAEGNPGGNQTRAVEYQIDEEAKTATLVWEWPGDFDTPAWYKTELYVPFWGDADRLPNGNVLITAGRRGGTEETPNSRVIEVTKDTGEVVWELQLPQDYGVYRSERLTQLPLVKPIAPE